MNKSTIAVFGLLLAVVLLLILFRPGSDAPRRIEHGNLRPDQPLVITEEWTPPPVDKPLDLQTFLGNPVTSDGRVFLLVGLQGCNQNIEKRAPLNLSIVIDKSGSMMGGKLDQVKQAAKMLVNNMNEQDVLSIVTYDTQIKVILPASYVNDKNDIIQRINQIHASGNTNLFGGVTEGYNQLRTFKSDSRINKILLLSDGLANVGVINPSAISNYTTQMNYQGLGISTVGVGTDYNENLMVSIAEKAGGNYYYINEPMQLAEVFKKELNMISQTVAKNLRIEITLPDGVDLIKIYGNPRFTRSGNIIYINPSDISRGIKSAYLLELKAENGKGLQDLANVSLNYNSPALNRTFNEAKKVRIKIDPGAGGQDPLANRMVLKYHTKYQLSEANYVAADELDKGDNSAARTKLEQAYNEAKKAQEKLKDAEIAEQMTTSQKAKAQVEQMGTAPAASSETGRHIKKAMQQEAFNDRAR